ncbi:sulfatase family protein [Labilibaculum antarcticum]|uniref:Heparan N-sulfatase n=1 Tax=Labilibaculum antarcticum TaxID=1717717 RepID=A0A1Y1CII9_9BACT|nr:sulfatase [Labilibaculum antarcticum]BAX79091.1 heparan N-sulfatase [Labilibaculum antarcticum]
MNKLLTFVSGIALLASVSSCQPKQEEVKRPNILFAIADDASWKTFGAYGCDWVKTPAFDKVAERGLLFSNAYTPNAKCAPSRSIILTGRNSWQLEEAANHAPYFPAKFKTYAEALGENGYWVGSIAKGWAPGEPGSINGKPRELAGPKFDIHTATPPTTGISDNDYAKNFEAFLEARPKGEPFCFWYGSKEPHRSYEFKTGITKGGKITSEIDEVPTFWPDVDSVRTDMLDYAFEIEHFDSHLQKMLKKLEEIGELDNTIVIVTADNGMPFPRIKGQVYEYSNHLPLAIMWPKGIKKPGRVISDFVNFNDFTPTYLELAGLTAKGAGMQPVTGKSLTDIFYSEKDGKVSADRDHILVGKERHDVGRPNDEGYPVRGIFKGDFLYLHNFKTERWPQGNPETGYLNCDGSPTKSYILDTRRKKGQMEYWQMNFGKRVSDELYNIKKDPYCMKNLIEDTDFAELVLSMKTQMETELKEQADPRILGNGDIFDEYEYSGPVKDFYNRYMKGEDIPTHWVNKSDFDTYLKEK